MTDDGVITSRTNERLKRARRLHGRRARRSSGLFLVEGEDLVEAAWSAGIRPLELLAAPGAAVPVALEAAAVRVLPDLLAELGTLGHPARVLAIYRAADLPRSPVGDVVLELHGVRDPGNVGTLVRALAALGPGSVVLGHGTVDPLSPRAARASMGAIFRVPVVDEPIQGTLRVALAADGDVVLCDVDLLGPVTFLLGGERSGVPGERRASADVVARIPQEPGVDSLNVAMAGTVALYERRRQHR